MKSIMPGLFIGITALCMPPAQAQSVKLSPVESYTVVYDVRGSETGTITIHSRKFDTEQAQILALSKSGKAHGVRIVTMNDKIFIVDAATSRVREAVNEGYARLAKAAAGKSGNTIPKAMMQSLGFVPTGVRASYAGETCMNWENKALKQKRCVTDDGIALRVELAASGGQMVQTAKSLKRGDSGQESAFAIPANKAH